MTSETCRTFPQTWSANCRRLGRTRSMGHHDYWGGTTLEHLGPLTQTEADALLAANLEFYRAFTMHDLPAMERVWAAETPVLCLHPGWELLRGRSAVLESWRQILSNPQAPHVMAHADHAFLFCECGILTCSRERPTACL